MMSPDKSQKAKVIQVLLWYDRPEVLLLETSVSQYVLAVRSGSMDSSERTYVGGTMTKQRLRDYADGKCDLRFAIAHANLRKFWKFELPVEGAVVTLNHIKRSDVEIISSLPESGLFSRDHENIRIFDDYIPNTIEKFNIDGSWDLGEFSQFYGQMEDIYYIVADIERFDDPAITSSEKNVITEAFDRSWDGGGSYVAFYRSVANDNDFHAPLRVSGIKYNSPGYVEIHANREPFDTLMAILDHFSSNEASVRKAYNAINAFMSVNKLRRSSSSMVLTDGTRTRLTERARDLEAQLPGVSFDALLAMTGGNLVTAVKVIMSVFRRVERLFRFFDEGRVAHSGIDLV